MAVRPPRELTLGRLARYLPAADWLRKAGCASSLDVGSGPPISGFLLPGSCLAIDLRRSAGATGPAVRSSACALPFRDGAFEAVLLIDLLEHLPPPDRAGALREAWRVARRFVIASFPSGERARACDGRIARDLASRGKPLPDWLAEHLSLPFPEPKAVEALLRAQGARTERYWHEGLATHARSVLWEQNRLGLKLSRWAGRSALAPLRAARGWRRLWRPRRGNRYRAVVIGRKEGE